VFSLLDENEIKKYFNDDIYDLASKFVNNLQRPCSSFHDQEYENSFKQHKEIDNSLFLSFSWSVIKEKKITNPFDNYCFQQHDNAYPEDGIKKVCDINLHLTVHLWKISLKVIFSKYLINLLL